MATRSVEENLARRVRYWELDLYSGKRPGRREAWAGLYEFPRPKMSHMVGDEPEFDPNYEPPEVG